MAIRSLRVLTALARGDTRAVDVAQRAPVCIVLPPRPGHTPSELPPVRIFVGSEPAQFRAERVFVYSLERVRDPARTYEIHLMREFAGFKRRLWLTGFTNYRFAIPDLAGRQGRAIYNDTDQIYLDDPAKLFDTPMGDHGVLSIHDHDTSVMLMDCARMAPLWNAQTARSERNRKLEEQMREAGLWAQVDGGWNARDEEYVPGESMLVHYTTIHTQPWRPFPDDYVYRANVAAGIWQQIEDEADAAGFQLFDAAHPSPDFAALDAPMPPGDWRLEEYRRLAAATDVASVQYCGFGDAAVLADALVPAGVTVEAIHSITPRQIADNAQPGDMVVADGLEQLPDLDMGWLLDALFARARQTVCITVDPASASRKRSPGEPLWWYAQLCAAASRNPGRHWRLAVRERRFGGRVRIHRWTGGPLLGQPPRTWTLLHYKTGHRSQAVGVADALGWPYASREILRAPLAYLWAALRARLQPAHAELPGNIRPPWPELVIASGWLPSLVARWIAARNHQATRLVLMGRRGVPAGESQDVAIGCRHFDLVPHPRNLETLLPPSKVDADTLDKAATRWPDLFAGGSHPHVVLLAGGANPQHRFTSEQAGALGSDLRKAVETAGGTLAVMPSRRTGAAAAEALRAAVGEGARFEPWQGHGNDANPYLGYLATADIIVVTGESESMLAEAVATGKPVYIVPLPQARPNLRRRVADWVVRQARADRFNARGSRRPQQGLQYLCARLVQRRVFLPPRDMHSLHDALIEQGVARRFEGSLTQWQPAALNETEVLGTRLRAMLGVAQDGAPPAHAGQDASQARDRRAAHA